MTNKKSNKGRAPRAPAKNEAKAPTETKKEHMLALLRREGGATLEEVGKLTGWQAHSTRAVLTGLRKRGFAFQRTRAEGVTRYSISAEPSA